MSAGAAPTYLAFDIGGTKVASGFVTLPAARSPTAPVRSANASAAWATSSTRT